MDKEFKVIRLRQAVSVVVFKEDKFLMTSSKGWPENSWCFPQGGINSGETHFEAAKRELKEELGTDKFNLFTKSKIEHTYLFPDKIKGKKGCEGQYQTVWFAEFFGDFEDIKPNKDELMQQAWFKREEIIKNMAYPEQKETFKKVLEELDKLRENKIF